MARCVAGDEAAWRELLARYADLIFSIPLRRGLGHDAAEEIFQSVSVTLSQRLHLIEDPTCLPKWLMVTTSRRTTAWVSSSRRSQELTPEMVGATTDDPESLSVDAERTREVQAALAELKERDRRILLHLFQGEKSYAEVASELGVAVGSLGALRARALGRLRKALEKRGFL